MGYRSSTHAVFQTDDLLQNEKRVSLFKDIQKMSSGLFEERRVRNTFLLPPPRNEQRESHQKKIKVCLKKKERYYVLSKLSV